ncbi:MAG: Rad52/Rad22 family DNA repair protein [Terriglobia bacterium]|nr:Rad52/Rad22 family DNA repair protein [Terriglobia bacterium]
MATTKFTDADRERLFAQLEVPFDPAQIKWRVMRTSNDGRSGVILPFADPRAYSDRLNQLFTPAGWTREYSLSAVPSLTRVDRGKVVVTSKVLIATAVTIHRLGSHTGTGEEWADRENAVTAADAQAFKRACSCFGLGRYLYAVGETWVNLNGRGEPLALPALPAWALPPGVTMQPISGQSVDVRGPVDHRLTAEIEGFRSTLGVDIYEEILRRAGHSKDARTIPNAERQKNVVEWMRGAARGVERLHGLVEADGDARFIAAMDKLKFSTTTCLPSLAALKQLIEELESISGQQVA